MRRQRSRACGARRPGRVARCIKAFTFAGHREDIPARAADIFVLPSQSEAFPNALLEAMASELPIVASAVGGIVELIDEGRTGVLVRAADPLALADGMCRLMPKPAAAAQWAAPRAHVEARYSVGMVTGFDEVYLSQLAGVLSSVSSGGYGVRPHFQSSANGV